MKFWHASPKYQCCCFLIAILFICWFFNVKHLELLWILVALIIYFVLRKKEHFSECNLAPPDYYGAILDPSNDAIRVNYGQTYDEKVIKDMNDAALHALAEENVRDMLDNVDEDTVYNSQYGPNFMGAWDPLENPDSPYTQILGADMNDKKWIELVKEKSETESGESAKELARRAILLKEVVRLKSIRRIAKENEKSRRLLEAEAHNPDIILPLDTWFKADQGAKDIFGKKSCDCPAELNTQKIMYSKYSENPEDVWENEFQQQYDAAPDTDAKQKIQRIDELTAQKRKEENQKHATPTTFAPIDDQAYDDPLFGEDAKAKYLQELREKAEGGDEEAQQNYFIETGEKVETVEKEEDDEKEEFADLKRGCSTWSFY